MVLCRDGGWSDDIASANDSFRAQDFVSFPGRAVSVTTRKIVGTSGQEVFRWVGKRSEFGFPYMLTSAIRC